MGSVITSSARLDWATIIEIAGDLLDESGLETFRLGAVADRAGVTQPALYRHVDGAAGVWRGLGLVTRRTLAARLRAAVGERSGTDAVHAVSHAWRAFAHQHPGRYRSTDRYPVRGDAQLEAAVDEVRSALHASLQGFDMPDARSEHAAVMLRSALHGFVSFELGDGTPGDIDRAFDHLVDQLCSGFDREERAAP
ncbi:MAG: WHG domain-containing protein [Ilumatobacter sp.]